MNSPFNYGFSKFSDSAFEALSFAIVTGFADNPTFFPAPHPELDAATAAQTAFAEALAAARGGAAVAIALKKQKRGDLRKALLSLGSWGTIKADGDPVKLAATNFPLRKQASPSAPLGVVELKAVENLANPGDAAVSINKVTSGKWYRFEYTLDPTTDEWEGVNSTRIKVTFSGLEPGKLYYFRVTAYGINGQESVSDVVQKMIY